MAFKLNSITKNVKFMGMLKVAVSKLNNGKTRTQRNLITSSFAVSDADLGRSTNVVRM